MSLTRSVTYTRSSSWSAAVLGGDQDRTLAEIPSPLELATTRDKVEVMSLLGWLIVAAVLVVVAVAAFVVIRRRSRTGGVIATKSNKR